MRYEMPAGGRIDSDKIFMDKYCFGAYASTYLIETFPRFIFFY